MSQKSHPVGLRLLTSKLWVNAFDLNDFSKKYQQQFFLKRWLEGFFKKNYFFLFFWQLLYQTRLLTYLVLFFYSPVRKFRKRKKRLVIQRYKFVPVRRRKRLRNKRKNKRFGFFRLRHNRLKYKFSWNIWYWRLFLFPKYVRRSFFLTPKYARYLLENNQFKRRKKKGKRLYINPKTRRYYYNNAFLKKKKWGWWCVRKKKQDLLVIFLRFRLLRLKNFFEQRISQMLNAQKMVCFLTNLGELLQHKGQGFFRKTLNFHNGLKRVAGVGLTLSVSHLFYLSATYARPEVIHQWLYYALSLVKKHSILYSQRSYILIFTRALERLVYFHGVLGGFRVLLNGKIGGSTRTKLQEFRGGTDFSHQRFIANFSYHFQQIPTYAGVLGSRLWYLYSKK